MKIGESILNIRKEQEMTQEEFASIFSVTRQTVSNWENEKSYPDLQTLVDISDRFEISLDSMLKENVEMVRKIDRERKLSRYVKRGTIAILGIIAFFCVIWTILWYDTKQEMERTFQQGIDKYGFSYNTEEDAYQYPYVLEEEAGIRFALYPVLMPGWLSFSLDAYNQELICMVQREDCLIQLEWYGKSGECVNVCIYDKTGPWYLEDTEAKKLLRDDEQLKEVNHKAKEMCQNLYKDFK